MKTQLEKLYQEMMAEKPRDIPRDIKKVRYRDYYFENNDFDDLLLSPIFFGLGITLMYSLLFFDTSKIDSPLHVLGFFLSFFISMSLYGCFGVLYHRLLRLFVNRKLAEKVAINTDDPEIVLKVISWQEGKFNTLKDETTTRIAKNLEKAEQNKQRTENSLRNLEERLDTLSLSDLAPIYEERIACAKILINNFEQEILKAKNQLQLVKKEEGDIQEILAELRFYYDDVDAGFVLEQAKKANIAIIEEREAIDKLIAKLSEQLAKSSGLLIDIRDGKLQEASKAAACLEIGYNPDLDLEHEGHETNSISTGQQ
ncbi:MAG: hypothetical protein WCV58_02825 [Patescibacteria group bacterium]